MPISLYDTANSLEEFIMIGGSEKELNFTVYDQDGTPVILTGCTCTWVASEYGSDVVEITKTGTITGANTFQVLLEYADTSELMGKFTQQPIVTEASGKVHTSQQGQFIILSRIK